MQKNADSRSITLSRCWLLEPHVPKHFQHDQELIQYKLIYRTHLYEQKLHKMWFSESENCPHCTLHTSDTYFHATWYCTPIQHFWSQITDIISQMLDCPIPTSPSLCLLGDLSQIKQPEQSLSLELSPRKPCLWTRSQEIWKHYPMEESTHTPYINGKHNCILPKPTTLKQNDIPDTYSTTTHSGLDTHTQ